MTPTGTNLLGLVKHQSESREQVTDFYRQVWAHSDATIGELPLDARGAVRWWPEGRRDPTLRALLVHTIQETARHAGHADIIRESIDWAAGLREGASDMPAEAWYRRLETALRQAGGHRPVRPPRDGRSRVTACR